jgi:hypothetical protein
MSHYGRAIQIGLVALANGVELDPLRYIDLLDSAKRRDEWEAHQAAVRVEER